MSNSLPSRAPRTGFVRKLVLLLLFVVGISLWLYLLYKNQRTVAQPLMAAFVNICIALAAGLGSRMFFYKRNWFIRLVSAWASLVIGLFVLGLVTNWKLGIGPLEFWRKTIDWVEIAQLSGGMLVSVLGLSAWWRGPDSHPVEDIARTSSPAARKRRPRTQPTQLNRMDDPPRAHSQERWVHHARMTTQLKVAKQARAIERSAPRVEKVVIGRPARSIRSKSRRKLFQRKPELQISVYEEHRCPYCLDDVKRNDPRGVKECSVCHTLHHADCWDITGMCQVPHLNS